MNGRAGWLPLLLASGCGSLRYYDPPDDPTTSLEPPTEVSPPSTSSTTSSTSPSSTTSTSSSTTPSSTSSTTTSTPTEPTETTGTTDPGVALSIDSVEPAFGSNGGGLEVTIEGTFDNQTDVEVNGVAARISDQRPSRITFDLPPSTVVGHVDVRVSSGTRSQTLNEGFQYFEDAIGQAGLIGSVAYLEYKGGYWSRPNPRSQAWADLAFTTGPDWSMDRLYAGAMGTCEYDYAPAGLTPVELATGAPNMHLVDTATGLVDFRVAELAGEPGWFSEDLRADVHVVPGTTYSLEPMAGNADWPAFDLPRMVRIPGPFNVTTPRLAANNLQPQGRAIDFAWGGSGGDYVLISVVRTTAAGADNGAVSCVVPDTGSFRIPANTWPNWPINNTLYMQVGRVFEQGGTVPTNDGENRVAGVYWVYGATYSE